MTPDFVCHRYRINASFVRVTRGRITSRIRMHIRRTSTFLSKRALKRGRIDKARTDMGRLKRTSGGLDIYLEGKACVQRDTFKI